MGWTKLTCWPEPPSRTPAEIVGRYLTVVREQVPAVCNAQAEVRGHTLWIAALVPNDREVERRLHAVELDIGRKWPEAPIEFRIYRQGE